MGGGLSKMLNKIFANREMRILMLGLDAAGKTSNLPVPLLRDSEEQKTDWGLAILYKLKLNQQYVFTIE